MGIPNSESFREGLVNAEVFKAVELAVGLLGLEDVETRPVLLLVLYPNLFLISCP